MAKKLLLVNLLMLVGVLWLAQHLVNSWAEFEKEAAASQPAPARPRDTAAGTDPTEVFSPDQPESIAPFLIIPEKNLFSETRGLEPETGEDDPSASAPALAVKPRLVSVSTFNGVKQAVMTVFEGNRGAKPETQVVNLGDQLQGYQVSRIDDGEVGLSWNGVEMHSIPLDTSAAEARQVPTRSQQAVRIITVGSAVAAVETVAASESADDQRGIEVGVVSAAAAGQNTRGRSGLGGAGRGQPGGLGAGGRGSAGGLNQLGGRSTNTTFNPNSGRQAPIGFGSAPTVNPNNPPNP